VIFHDVEPRSQEWFQLRLAIPTSSCFDQIITPAKLAPSSQVKKYLRELLAEYITGVPITQIAADGDEPERYQSRWMERGQETEDSVCKAYEAYTETQTSRGGFFTTDDGMIGASPDRVVGEHGLLEAKAPALTTQIGYALAGGAHEEYTIQLQGQLLVSEREWVDIFSWHPKLFIPPVRVYRDEKIQQALKTVLVTFVSTMLLAREQLETRFGPFTRPEPRAAQEIGDFGVSDADVEMILEAHRKGKNGN
jgi:hypothetical protein